MATLYKGLKMIILKALYLAQLVLGVGLIAYLLLLVILAYADKAIGSRKTPSKSSSATRSVQS
jgi:hypothetical protein